MTFEGGANQWRRYDSWPPKTNVTARSLFFRDNGGLSFDAPVVQQGAPTFDSYVSDPAHPVPYRHRPIQATYDPRGSGWYTWLTEDQRFVRDRPDVLSWETPPLTEDVTIAGDITADLFAATTGSDADWIVKLIDVYPENVPDDAKMGGYEFMIANEVFRGRYRNSMERPQAITPNQTTEFKYSLHTQSYRSQKGHRIMVQVQSSWFPLVDRNPQTYVDIYTAKDSDFRKATQRVHRSKERASRLVAPVLVR